MDEINWKELVTKGLLKAFGDKSKGLFLYPKSTTGANSSWIISDINLGLNFRELYLRVLCISKEEDVFAPVDSIIGLVSDENAVTFASCINEGKHTIESIRFYIDESILKIAAKLKGTTGACSVLAQVIGTSSKEEIIKEVTLADSCNPQDYWQIGDSTDDDHLIDGEIYNNSDSTVSFTIKNGSNNPSYPETNSFDTIEKAKLLSHQLKFNYDFNQSQGDGDEDVLVGNLSDHIYIPIPELSLSDLAPKEEGTYVIKVTKDELENTTSSFSPFPTANINTVGGISIYSNNDELSEGNYPVKLNNENKAYVNLSDITNEVNELSTSVSNIDVHRFEDLDNVPEEVKKPGMIVQYIGPKTSKYTKGWFYQYTPIEFTVSKDTNKWGFTEVTVGKAIALHNAAINYQINSGELLLLAHFKQIETEVTDTTIFKVILNNAVIEELSYEDIKNIFKIHIEDAYLSKNEYSNCTLTLSVGANSGVWAQKNVQPLFEAQSALVYKGTVDQYEDLEAKIPDAQPGDVWTVLDNGQEYFYKESESIDWQEHWEFMGLILDVSEYKGDHTEDQNVFADVSVTDIVGSKDKLISTHYNSREADNSTTVQVGGIAANTTAAALRGKTISEMLDMILFPDAEPTHTNESITLNYSGSRSVRYGTTAPAASDFSNTISKGTWSYYSDTSNYAGDYSVGNVSGTFTPDKLTSNTTYSQTATFTSTNAGTPTTKKGVDRSNLKYNKTGGDAKKSSTVTISVWKPYFIGKVKAGYEPTSTEWFTGASTTSDNVTTINVVTTESDSSTYTGLKTITGDVTGNNGHIFIAVPAGSAVQMYDPNFLTTQWTMDPKITKSGTISTGVQLSYDIYVKTGSGTDTQVYIKTS